MTISLTKPPGPTGPTGPDHPDRPDRTALHLVTAGWEPKPAVDITKPIRPAWLLSWDSFRPTAVLALRRAWYRTVRFLFHLPILVFLLVTWSPRGLWRLTARASKFIYDSDTADLRAAHSGRQETAEAIKVHAMRRANLHARAIVVAVVALPVLVPVLAWTAPKVLAGLVAVLVFGAVCKLIPGRGAAEVVGAVCTAGLVWWFLPGLLALIPAPPVWSVLVVGAVTVGALGYIGRPAGRTMVQRSDPNDAGIPDKPTAPIVIDALVRLNITGLTDKTRDEVRVFSPGVARSRRGYHLALELPAGVTASDVMDKREALAAALRRELGTVWPSQGDRHPGHLILFISDQPMATAPQDPWPVAEGVERDIFEPMEHFTDQEGQWVKVLLAYQQIIVGGAPGYGKTYGARQLGVGCAFDPRTRITCMDGKGNGDLRPLRLVAHGFFEGDEPEDIAKQLAAVRAIREEMRRRAKFLRELSREENPQSKVTSELVDRYPHLAPIVLIIDEVQVFTEHEDEKIRKEFIAILTDLVKRGRSAGIIPLFCTQKPDARALPSSIADNCSLRICFRVNTANANNQVLGNGMYAMGIRATLFSAKDKGLAWLRGDAAEPQVVRTVFGLDAVAAEELVMKARAIRERKGLLTGQAAGEKAQEEAVQVSLLDDCRDVMDHPPAKALTLDELRESLASLRPTTWGHLDNTALGAMLREAGVPVSTVWSSRAKTDGKGVKRSALNIAATSDVDPDEDDEDTVIDLTR